MMRETEIVGFRLSPLQRRLWRLGAGEPISPYRTQGVFALRGTLDFAVFKAVVSAISTETELLRTTFNSLPDVLLPMQVIHDDLAPSVVWKDCLGQDAKAFEATVEVLTREEWQHPMALDEEAGVRWILASRTPEDHRLVLTMTALLADEASLGLLVEALAARLDGTAPEAEDDEEPMQFGDVSEWQHELLESEEMAQASKFWERVSASTTTLPGLPGLPTLAETMSPEWISATLSDALVADLGQLTASCQLSREIVLLALWQAYLGRRTGKASVPVGVLTQGRKHGELEGLPGPLSLFLPMTALDLSLSLVEASSSVSGHRSAALAWQEYYVPGGFGEDRQASPPFLFSYCEAFPSLQTPALEGEVVAVRCVTDRFQVLLRADMAAELLRLELSFDSSSLPRQGAQDLLEGFQVFLSTALETPTAPLSSLEILGCRERDNLVQELNATAKIYPKADVLLHQLFEEQVKGSPDAVALLWEDGSLTYRELDEEANRLAHHLRSLGVGPDLPVAVILERSPEMVVSLLAVLKAGGAYLPVDPSYPELRIAAMFEDAPPSVILTEERLVGGLPTIDGPVVSLNLKSEALAAYPIHRPDSGAGSEHLAYVLFTSGSTGRPKGVMIPHRAIVHHMLWMGDRFPLTAEDRVLQKTPFSFDASVWEFYAPLQAGGTLVIARPGGHMDSDYLVARMKATGVTILQVVPTQLRMLLETEGFESCTALRRVLCGGEALPAELAEDFLRRVGDPLGVELFNVYGPSEGTIHATVHEAHSGLTTSTVPIGRPISNVRVYIADPASGRLLPAGVPGELLVGGAGLGRGYFCRPRLTAELFLPDPFSGQTGARLYRTGDRVRLDRDGLIEYLGRFDFMVKLHGYRIELGEIEEVLRSHPSVREAVVLVHRQEAEAPRLAAYWEGADDGTEGRELRSYLGERLSAYMVPHHLLRLEALPLTPNGKLDRKALPEPVVTTGADIYVAPASSKEEVMTAIWSEVLGVEEIGVEHNFFALGADSIRAVRVVALAKERGFEMTLADLFEQQTVRDLVRVLQDREPGLEGRVTVGPLGLLGEADRSALPEDVEDAYPMTSMQLGMIYHMQLNPEEPSYHNITSFRLLLKFSETHFREAVERVVERHPILRTSFDLDHFSEPLQLVHRRAKLPVVIEDLSGLDGKSKEAILDALVRQQRTHPFDLSEAPQLRFFLHLLNQEELWFTVVENHAILDGWSLTSILREVLTHHDQLLAGEASPEDEPLGTSFREYVRLEREALASDDCRDYWDQVLSGSKFLKVPRWRSVASQAGDSRVASHPVDLTAEVREGLHRLSREAAVPLKSVCLLAHLKVLSVISGEQDILTGLPCHGRPEAADSDRIRGLFLNTVPFRLVFAPGETWKELAIRVFEVERAFLPFRRYPLSAIRKNWHDRPLFEVLFSFVHFHHLGPSLSDGSLSVLSDYKGWEANQYALMCGFNQHPPDNELKLRLYFDAHELLSSQVEAFAGCFQQVLDGIAREPEAAHDLLQLTQWDADGGGSPLVVEAALEGLDEGFDFD